MSSNLWMAPYRFFRKNANTFSCHRRPGLAQQSLNDLKNVGAQTSILVPVGGGTFVNAELGDIKKVIVGIGADVSVEMELDKAISDISSRLEEVEKAQAAVEQQLTQIVAQMQSHQEIANRLNAELQGETKRV